MWKIKKNLHNETKGIEYFIKAADILVTKYDKVEFLIAGAKITSQTKYSEMGAEPNPELLQRLQDEEREILNLISQYPGYEQFATGISVLGLKEKKDEKAT